MSRLYGHRPMCPDFMDTVPCGHPVYIHTLLAVLRHSAGPHSCDTVVEHNQWWYNAVVGHTVVKHSDSTLTTVCTKDTYCYCNAVIKQRHISCIMLYIIFYFHLGRTVMAITPSTSVKGTHLNTAPPSLDYYSCYVNAQLHICPLFIHFP